MEHCGIDLSVKSSSVCVMDGAGKVVLETVVSTDEAGLGRVLKGRKRLRCLLEASPLAEWVAGLVEGLGHEAVVIDTRKATGVIRTKKKTDRLDARNLAKMSRTGWYSAVHRKSEGARQARTFLQARHGLVETAQTQGARIRGLLRAHGIRLGAVPESQYAASVKRLTMEKVPQLWPVLEALLKVRGLAMEAAAQMKRQLEVASREDPVRLRLMTVPGVGPITAAAYVATIDDPRRFRRGDQVAAYLGLVPSVNQSGELDRHGHITRDGDKLLRSYLFEAAHVLLTRKRGSSSIRRWGLKLARKKGYGKAKVAVARKLAVLLHHLWISGESYLAA
jgi:transposase